MRYACRTAIVLTAVTLFAPAVCFGHHSRGHYAAETTEMEGELVDITWRNPHVYFRLRTTDTDGRERLAVAVTIPGRGPAESLNVAVAAGVLLHNLLPGGG